MDNLYKGFSFFFLSYGCHFEIDHMTFRLHTAGLHQAIYSVDLVSWTINP